MKYPGSQRIHSSDDSVPLEPVVATQAGRGKHAERRDPVGERITRKGMAIPNTKSCIIDGTPCAVKAARTV